MHGARCEIVTLIAPTFLRRASRVRIRYHKISRLFPIVAFNVAFSNRQRAIIDDFTDFREIRAINSLRASSRALPQTRLAIVIAKVNRLRNNYATG
jgi:hypothetical protein